MNSPDNLPLQEIILLDVQGMKCAGCVRSVEAILLGQEGVLSASVNLVSRTAYLELKDPDKPLDQIFRALAQRGFPAQLRDQNPLEKLQDSQADSAIELWRQWKRMIFALLLLLLSGLGHLAEGGFVEIGLIGTLPFHAALATFALLGPGRKILQGGLSAALAASPTMDTLVGLGVSSAYIASLVALVWPQVGWPCFFNEPVMLLGFVLLGRFMEERARFRTGRALKQLAELQPDNARLVMGNGRIKEVRVGSLRVGDKVQLLAGDRIPVDGVVEEGSSAVDISSLTGEPLPLEASPGTELSSGSLNLESTLVLRVKLVGAQTALARIIALVERAQARKAPIQGLADRIAGRFCYGVVLLAIGTFFFWWLIGTRLWPHVLHASGQGLLHGHSLHSSLGSGAETPLGLALQLAIAVLVVACPCALGLATPTVITVSSGQAARKGWLFRGGDVIEMAASLKQVAFDKTGTLTLGRPLVSAVMLTKEPGRMFQLASCLEENSRHPLAQAVTQEAQRYKMPSLKPLKSSTVPGSGISGEIEGVDGIVRVGNPEWLRSQKVIMEADIQKVISAAAGKGQSLVGVSCGEKLLGLIAIEDRLRPDSFVALDRLRNQGFKMTILSGDRREAVERLGLELGFKKDQLFWGLLPARKLEELERLKGLGPLAMVGDGINDAPALAAADLGIAVGTGTQIAQETADLVLLGDRLEGLPEALLLARKTMDKVRQNLSWAFGYNLIALPIAAGVLLPGFGLLLSPPIAALLMALSSITVVVNALTLRST